MFGPGSLSHLMQIYNEYLRDYLLLFENYEVIISKIRKCGKLGLTLEDSFGLHFCRSS